MKNLSWAFLENRIGLAKKYLSEGDRVGACALAGAVIETSLRQISIKYGLSNKYIQKCIFCGNITDGLTSIGRLIQILSEEKRINMELKKYLDQCRTIRNKASHGYFGEIKLSEAKLLINGADIVVQFGIKYFKDDIFTSKFKTFLK